MSRTLARRLTRLEGRQGSTGYPCALVVPAKPRTDAERQRFAERFLASQTALVEDARSERIAIECEAPATPPLIAARKATNQAEVPPRMRGQLGAYSASKKLSIVHFARMSGVQPNNE